MNPINDLLTILLIRCLNASMVHKFPNAFVLKIWLEELGGLQVVQRLLNGERPCSIYVTVCYSSNHYSATKWLPAMLDNNFFFMNY